MPNSLQTFLDLYDGLGLLQPLPGLLQLLAQPRDLLVLGKQLLAGPGRTVERSLIMLTASLRQMRRVMAFPPQERADLSGLDAGLRFVQYAHFVTGAEPATLGLGNHLRRRDLPDSIGVRRVGFVHSA